MVFCEGAYPEICEDGMSLHLSLLAKYDVIRGDLVYKLQNLWMDLIFSKLCSGEGGQYSGSYMAGLRCSACKSFRNKGSKKVKENITSRMKKLR